MSLVGGESGATSKEKSELKKIKMEPGTSGSAEWRPPVFSNTAEDVHRYFRTFKRVANANGWSEDRRLSVLPAPFTEEAEWVAEELESASPATVERPSSWL